MIFSKEVFLILWLFLSFFSLGMILLSNYLYWNVEQFSKGWRNFWCHSQWFFGYFFMFCFFMFLVVCFGDIPPPLGSTSEAVSNSFLEKEDFTSSSAGAGDLVEVVVSGNHVKSSVGGSGGSWGLGPLVVAGLILGLSLVGAFCLGHYMGGASGGGSIPPATFIPSGGASEVSSAVSNGLKEGLTGISARELIIQEGSSVDPVLIVPSSISETTTEVLCKDVIPKVLNPVGEVASSSFFSHDLIDIVDVVSGSAELVGASAVPMAVQGALAVNTLSNLSSCSPKPAGELLPSLESPYSSFKMFSQPKGVDSEVFRVWVLDSVKRGEVYGFVKKRFEGSRKVYLVPFSDSLQLLSLFDNKLSLSEIESLEKSRLVFFFKDSCGTVSEWCCDGTYYDSDLWELAFYRVVRGQETAMVLAGLYEELIACEYDSSLICDPFSG